jgi:hypothetical protein
VSVDEGNAARQILDRVEDRGKRRLDALVTDDVRQWCSPSTVVAYGKPYLQILESAARKTRI